MSSGYGFGGVDSFAVEILVFVDGFSAIDLVAGVRVRVNGDEIIAGPEFLNVDFYLDLRDAEAEQTADYSAGRGAKSLHRSMPP